MIAGNGTIGLEILEDLPDVDTVVIPVGGGGLATGIATAIKALRPQARIVTAEPETGAALHAALRAGEPTDVDYETSFVDGSGSRRVLDAMWPRLRAARRRGAVGADRRHGRRRCGRSPSGCA